MPNSEVLLKDVYAHSLGDQIIYWRIGSGRAKQPVLEWAVVDTGRNLSANRFAETESSAIAAMKSLQRPERCLSMKEVNPFLLECFHEWGWIRQQDSGYVTPIHTVSRDLREPLSI